MLLKDKAIVLSSFRGTDFNASLLVRGNRPRECCL